MQIKILNMIFAKLNSSTQFIPGGGGGASSSLLQSAVSAIFLHTKQQQAQICAEGCEEDDITNFFRIKFK